MSAMSNANEKWTNYAVSVCKHDPEAKLSQGRLFDWYKAHGTYFAVNDFARVKEIGIRSREVDIEDINIHGVIHTDTISTVYKGDYNGYLVAVKKIHNVGALSSQTFKDECDALMYVVYFW